MASTYQLLSTVCFLISGIAYIFIVIEAFKDEIWKGVLALLCGIYLLYYAIREWDHDNQWLVLIALIGGGIMGRLFLMASAMQVVPQ